MIGHLVADQLCRHSVARFTAIEAVSGLLDCAVRCDIDWNRPVSGPMPAMFALGERAEGFAERQRYRASPRFRTLAELDAFCLRHLDDYARVVQQIEVNGALPARWFWQAA